MASSIALLALLSLTGPAFAAPRPVAYDDGSWNPSKYPSWPLPTDAPTIVAPPTGVPTSTETSTTHFIETSIVATTFNTKFNNSTTAAPTSTTDVIEPTSTTVITEPTETPTQPTTPVGEKQEYSGDGSDWPKESEWVSYETMWEKASAEFTKSCPSGVKQNTPEDMKAISEGIEKASEETKVDKRFILAVITQESHGCVRINPTANGVHNPGLMQSHNGKFNCETVGEGECPKENIYGMIRDGTFGTTDGSESSLAHGLQWAAEKGAKDSQATYWSARLYNAGDNSYVPGGDLVVNSGATNSYPSDIANRLTGHYF